jgi:formylglycine-generating enzyme required for sulfatase activity
VVKADEVGPGIPRFKNLKDQSQMVLVPGTDMLIDEAEVTNAQYRKFVEETGYRKPAYADNPRYADAELPVVGVSWKDAIAYCQWAGKTLPSEKMWETAARGGLAEKVYPWGDDDPQGRAQFGEDNQSGQAKPVRSFDPNAFGLFDMAGNVWELCMEEDPEKPGFRAIRGGSFLQTKEAIGITSRNMLKENFIDSTAVGFRCVKRMPPTLLEQVRGKPVEPAGGASPSPAGTEPWPGAIPSTDSTGITTQTVTSGSIGNL